MGPYFVCTIEFRPTKQHANADGLSRLPLGNRHEASLDCIAIDDFTIGQIQALPVTTDQVKTATRQDRVLSQVYHYTLHGWPDKIVEEFKPFARRKQELTIEGNCVLWGNRVVIPLKLRPALLEELHKDHPGASRMKAVARSYFWYPGLDQDIEKKAQSCTSCQAVKNTPPAAPLHPSLWPTKPWQRIHVDFAGPFKGKTYLLVMDAHSKWPEIVEMNSTTSQRTIVELRKMFAAHGLPQQLVSDNGPQFISDEFAAFMKSNGIKHIRYAQLCELTVGEAVMAKNNKQEMPFVPGVVKKKLGPLTYLIETQNGLIWTRHIDHLKSLGHNNPDPGQSTDDEIIYPSWLDNPKMSSPSVPNTVNTNPASVSDQEPMRRYPLRESRRPPSRYPQQSNTN